MSGDADGAIAHYRLAAARTTSVAERTHLTLRATRLASASRDESATWARKMT
jgi:acyl-CoA reductase-like NAD-dependent aldehyde dehydrogenase